MVQNLAKVASLGPASQNCMQSWFTNNKTHEHKYYYGISDTQFKDSYEIVMMSSVPNLVEINTFINNWNLCLSEKDFIIRNLDEVNMLKKGQNLY